MKIALAQINPVIGDFNYNCQKILNAIDQGRSQGVQLVVFSEMAICGYPPEDLLLLPAFIQEMEERINQIIESSSGIAILVGAVRSNPYGGEKNLFNTAAFIQDRELIGYQDKILLPDYDVFSERRYFEPGGETKLWSLEGKRIAITVCEDIWGHAKAVEYSDYPRDPVDELKRQEPDLLINLSASPYYIKRHETRLTVCKEAAKTLRCPVLFCNQIGGNDGLIFDGYSLCVNQEGEVFAHAKGFEEDFIIIDTEKKYPTITLEADPIEDLFKALVLGVRDYFHKLKWKKGCLGLSGGIDSAVVAAIAKEALGPENVLALSLPSRFTSDPSRRDAVKLAQNLGIKLHEISLERPFEAYLKMLDPYFEGKPRDITEENLQARIRGAILMAFANKFGYLLLSTGNKSEMAMGYSTLYGDMCGALGVLSDVTKAQVYALAHYINTKGDQIPQSVIEKAPSAELRENQKDTDSLPPYAIVDAVLSDYVEEHLPIAKIAEKHQFPLELVKELVRKIHLNEYKRRQAPMSLRVTKKAFTLGRRFPIVHHWNMD